MVSMSKRSRVIWFGSAAALVLAGIVAAIGFGGTFGQVLAFVLISLGLVLATALVFFEVGLSEDRERAREEAARGEGERPRRSRPRLRLERRRGRRRRLG
jgi:membrane protein implicated in regulation of membrane protease activity